ncbi:unnamed protein product [Brassica rapa subsp. trilocularis]
MLSVWCGSFKLSLSQSSLLNTLHHRNLSIILQKLSNV